jgi:hypothetical protein
MQNIDLTDENFNKLSEKECSLAVQTDTSGFAYSVLEITANKFVKFSYVNVENDFFSDTQYYEKLTSLLKEEVVLKRKFNKATFIYQSTKFTLIPYTLFEEEQAEKLYSFNHQTQEGEKIQINELRNTEAYMIFSVPDDYVNMVESVFPKASILHRTGIFIENLIIAGRKDKYSNEAMLYADVGEGNFDIAVIENSRLKICNNFAFQNEKDFCYFIMFIVEQLKLNPGRSEVVLSGNIDPGSTEFQILKKYIRHISFATRSSFFTYGSRFDILPQHKFLNLFNVNRCE